MSLRINNNPASVNGIKNLQKNSMMVGKSMEKLSSGLRINRAADDAAGLIISEQMRAQITGLSTAISNSETAVNMVQTAEGALDEMNTMLNKARSLALQAANEGANDNAQLAANQSELDNIISSITRIAENTQFGTKKILDGSLDSFKSNSALIGSVSTGLHYAENKANDNIATGYHSIQITTQASRGSLALSGTLGTSVIETGADNAGGTIADMRGTEQFLKGFQFQVNNTTVSVVSGQTKNDLVAQLGALGRGAGFTVQAMSGANVTGNITLRNQDYGTVSQITYQFVSSDHTGAQGLTAAYTSGADIEGTLYLHTGVAGGTADTAATLTQALSGKGLTLQSVTATGGYRIELTQSLSITGADTTFGFYHGVIDGAGSGATFQVGANVGQKVSVEVGSMKASDIGRGTDGTYQSLEMLGGSLTSGNADAALKVIDKAIDDVTTARGRLGAFQANTLETGINSLKVTRENLIGAESTIRDVDFAVESANFTKLQIMVQSSTAMLAQANQLPQNVLQLLG